MVADAGGQVVRVHLGAVSEDEASKDASELLAVVNGAVGQDRPLHVSDLGRLLGEETAGKGLASSLILFVSVKRADLEVGRPSTRSELHGIGFPKAAPLDAPVVRLLD